MSMLELQEELQQRITAAAAMHAAAVTAAAAATHNSYSCSGGSRCWRQAAAHRWDVGVNLLALLIELRRGNATACHVRQQCIGRQSSPASLPQSEAGDQPRMRRSNSVRAEQRADQRRCCLHSAASSTAQFLWLLCPTPT